MQNIDPLYFIEPVVVVGFSLGLLIYWRYKRKSFTRYALLYSLAAYAGAIALKVIVQLPTVGPLESATGSNPEILGLYYGGQTALFEVGGAFLVAQIAFSKGHFTAKDGESFGLGLAFWENAVLLSIPTLLDYVIYYAVLANPNSSTAQTLYSLLNTSAPTLFYGASGALPLIGFAILERVSSLLGHFSWGYLAVLSAVYRKRIYLVIALPIGFLIDFLVPFSPYMSTGAFESLIFVIALSGFVITLAATRGPRTLESHQVIEGQVSSSGGDSPPAGKSP